MQKKRTRNVFTGTKKDPKVKFMCNLNQRHVTFLKRQETGGSKWLRDRIDEEITSDESLS